MTWNAIVLAGSRPGGDPLAARFGTDLKPLIPILGEPMVARPVRALLAAKSVATIVVLSQQPDRIGAALPVDPRVSTDHSGATIAATILALCRDPATPWPLIVTTADHALLDAATIDEFAAAASGADIAIGVVERASLLARFPTARRTWLKFRGGAFTGANLFALRSAAVARAIELWRAVEQDRKTGWRLVAMVGAPTLIGTVLRLVTIDHVLGRVGRKLGLSIRAVRLANPLAGIDVDKVEDHELVESILNGHQ